MLVHRYSNIALANLNGRTRHRIWNDQSALTTSFVGGETHHLSHRVDADGRTKTIVQISTSITEERDEIVRFPHNLSFLLGSLTRMFFLA